jgi:DNA-binding response OmpR family regulator
MARVLVVDDEEQVRAVLLRLLKLHGHVVETASDGAEALDKLEKKPYDLMIIDRNMPRLTGIEAVAMIRSSAKLAGMKILMVTQASVTKEVDQAFEAGVDGYVVKPFDFDRLAAKIEKTLGRRG